MYNTFFSLGVSVQHTEKLWQNVIGAGRWSHILNATTYCEAYCKEFFQQHKLNTKKMHFTWIVTLQTTCSCSFQWLDFSLLLTLAKANHSYCIHNILSSHPISLHLILSLSLALLLHSHYLSTSCAFIHVPYTYRRMDFTNDSALMDKLSWLVYGLAAFLCCKIQTKFKIQYNHKPKW